MQIKKLNLEQVLHQSMTIELMAHPNNAYQWLPILQHRGDQYDFNLPTKAFQLIGPVSNEFQELMSREQLKHSHLLTMTIQDLLTIKHHLNDYHFTSVKPNDTTFTLDLDTPVHTSVGNKALTIFKSETTNVSSPCVVFDNTTVTELLNYLLVTSDQRQAILSLDENWDKVETELRQPMNYQNDEPNEDINDKNEKPLSRLENHRAI